MRIKNGEFKEGVSRSDLDMTKIATHAEKDGFVVCAEEEIKELPTLEIKKISKETKY